MLCEDVVKGNAHGPLRLGKSFSLRVGTVGHKGENAFLSDLGKPLQINGVAEYRRVIYLKVSGMNHHARRRIDSKRGSVLDTVVCLDKLNPELAQINGLSVLHDLALCTAQKIVLF